MIDDALFVWLCTNVEVEESKVWHCNEAPLLPDCFASLAMTGKEVEIGANQKNAYGSVTVLFVASMA